METTVFFLFAFLIIAVVCALFIIKNKKGNSLTPDDVNIPPPLEVDKPHSSSVSEVEIISPLGENPQEVQSIEQDVSNVSPTETLINKNDNITVAETGELEATSNTDDVSKINKVTQEPAPEQNTDSILEASEPENKGEENGNMPPDESRKVDPLKRGGRPQGAEDETPTKCERKPRQLKPEIVCWKKGQQWILGVEIPEEIYDNGKLDILQISSPLHQDDSSREYCWRLTQAFGKVSVRSNAENFEIDLGKEGENYLLFKIIGKDMREGRRVKSPSQGSYLVVIPDAWKTTDDNADQIQVNVEGYQAYWQIFGDKTKIIFDTQKGKEKIQSESAKFQLVGSIIRDMTEDAGLLFGENPPQIKAHDMDDWNDVSAIIIGEIGEGKWRAEVPLEDDAVVQDLPAEVMERQSGRYFLRFYDKDNELIESQVFRFVRGLKSVKIPQIQPFSDIDAKHNALEIDVIHEENCVIEPESDSASDISVRATEGKTVLFIPANPDYDKTVWRVGHKSGSKVELTVLLERIWWGVGSENKEPSAWESQPEMLPKDKFLATSNLELWIHFPTPRWVDKVSIGFQQENKRDYSVYVSGQMLHVRLGEFPITNPYHENILGVWLEHNGKPYEGKVIVVSSLRPDLVGRGRYKTAKAMAMIRKGTGQFEVNELSFTEYFQRTPADAIRYWQKMSEHEQIRDVLLELDISIRVWGSNSYTKRTLKAVTHALAHALMQYKQNEPDLASILKRFRGVKVSQDTYENKEGLHNESD